MSTLSNYEGSSFLEGPSRDVLSLVFKGDSRAADYREFLDNRRLLVSFQSVAELWQWGRPRRQQLEAFLESLVCVHSTPGLCQTWSRVMSEARRQGKPILRADAWVAAVALALKLRLCGSPLAGGIHLSHKGLNAFQAELRTEYVD